MWWSDVPVFFRVSNPIEAPVEFDLGGGPTDSTTINMPLDIDAVTGLPAVPNRSTNFHHFGGHFVPPSDADNTPTGWFVSPTWNFALNTLASDFSNPAQFNPQVNPIPGMQRLYITYETGMLTIEEHFIGVPEYRPTPQMPENVLQAHTTQTIQGGPGNPGFTSTAPVIAGQVPVGYRIVGVPDRNGWHPFDYAAFAGANPGTLPTHNQNGLQAILTTADLAAVPGPVRIEWIFAQDSTIAVFRIWKRAQS